MTNLHVVVDGPAFFDGANDRREVVVREDHVCRVLREKRNATNNNGESRQRREVFKTQNDTHGEIERKRRKESKRNAWGE